MNPLNVYLLALWFLSIAGQVFLVLFVFSRRIHRQFPYFAGYLLSNIAEAIVLIPSYFVLGFWGPQIYGIAWFMHGITLVAKALAIVELCRRLLGQYPGIWAMARGVLTGCAVLLSLYSFLVPQWHWQLALPIAERGLQLSVAGVILTLFLFAAYYQVPIPPTERRLALGFCLYSSAAVLNNTVLQKYVSQYLNYWNITILGIFLLTIGIWYRALRLPAIVLERPPVLSDALAYQRISPEINDRLRSLDKRLSSLLRLEVPLS